MLACTWNPPPCLHLGAASQRQLDTRGRCHIMCAHVAAPRHRGEAQALSMRLGSISVLFIHLHSAAGPVESLQVHAARQSSAQSGNELYNAIRRLSVLFPGIVGKSLSLSLSLSTAPSALYSQSAAAGVSWRRGQWC